MEILKVLGLNKVYGKEENQVNALRDVNFTMEKGEFAAVVGESGSGKSTLLNCIGGLDLPTAGKVFLDGEDLYALDEKKRTIFRRRNIGFIFQAFHLIGELSVEQNIIFPLLLDRQKPDKEKLEELMEVLGIADRRKHLPGQLSGGQMQRVAIGRALIMRPMMILADEPTGNLDSRNSRDVMDLLVRAARHYQQTILMITHNMNLTSDADRVLRVTDGVLKDLGGKRHEKLS
ncbi:MAG: ABC transporter ATP-binding protein [Lachnospiraceae bacterium]|nr:ABC transporter ATP-binding protein [Lachnospiraceae bacterium]MDE6816854.1 ABC transporter ATP-binding protein [Lachnospiraceae bacterium]MDE6977267.1 ABC transporter ATP-binding protein [Lachnospiraceae bacterium]